MVNLLRYLFIKKGVIIFNINKNICKKNSIIIKILIALDKSGSFNNPIFKEIIKTKKIAISVIDKAIFIIDNPNLFFEKLKYIKPFKIKINIALIKIKNNCL